MTFPYGFEFKEYPKCIHFSERDWVTVHSKEEEEKILAQRGVVDKDSESSPDSAENTLAEPKKRGRKPKER